MPGAISRVPRSSKGKRVVSKSSAGDITSFARVSKLQSLGKDVADKLAASQTTPTRPPSIEIVLKSRKRSADQDFEATSTTPQSSHKKARKETDASPSHPIAPLKRKKKTVTFAEPEAPVVAKTKAAPTPFPRKRHFQADDAASSEAELLLGQLNLQSSPTPKRSRTALRTATQNDDADLPAELLDLLDLHIAFLKTLSMSYAHQSRHAPIDLRTLFSAITRAWGKRQVTLDDVRLCVGVLGWSPTKATAPQLPFFLADYGRSKVCIESHADVAAGPLREPKLAMDFEANLRALWAASNSPTAPLFLATLPKAPLKSCAAVHPILNKGQRTLTELKNGIVRKPEPAPTPAPVVVTANQDAPKPSLLDRLRLKALAASQSPAGPTPAELMRQAALHRAEDVAAVISMLCVATAGGGGGMGGRVAFPMPALLTKLRDSLRTPVSAEDGACCVRLLAGEVAPGWLRIVTVGGRENVVVTVAGQPGAGVIGERVKVLLG
ncbi:hypothetical protein QBC39DRAFT_263911 [Podospora conica]|nr:hypothetical protein QBC39DRAFT_263911 [Schizothecium conicum]